MSLLCIHITNCVLVFENFSKLTDNRTDPLPIRLVDGTSSQIGRIEIQYNGVWGTVCNRNFDISSANVACRCLGFVAASRLMMSTVRLVTDPIWLNNVKCFGNETSLEQCPHDGFGNDGSCHHSNDVRVECIGKGCYSIESYVCMYIRMYVHTYVCI